MPPLDDPQSRADRFKTLRLRSVWYIWFAVAGICLARGIILPNKNTCFPCYREGGLNWVHGTDLYGSMWATCRYSPFVHALLAPLSELPATLGAVVWRLLESAALMLALAWWLKSASARSLPEPARAWMLLITVPIMMGNIYNAQANVIMMAGLLVCLAAVNERRWTVAALDCVALACYFKIYPLAMAMLWLAILPRAFAWRFALALIAGALVPFLAQDPAYVVRQYGRWLDNLAGDDRSDWPLVNGYLDAWMLVRAFSLPLSFTAYRVFTVAMGALIGLLVIALHRRGDGGRDFYNRVFGLGCCWMTVFGPATEGHTYILLGTTLAWLTIDAARGTLPDWTRGPIYFSLTCFLISIVAQATPLIHRAPFLWTPLAALVLFGTLVRLAICYPVRAADAEPAADTPYHSSGARESFA